MDIKENKGATTLSISEEVIASIATTAAKDIPGVVGFSNRVPDVKSALKGKTPLKSVKVLNNDSEIAVTIYISIDENAKLTTVATKVQKAVKEAVQTMTGKVVGKVNVVVADVEFTKPEAEQESQEETEE